MIRSRPATALIWKKSAKNSLELGDEERGKMAPAIAHWVNERVS
jgi:hypothetical protein